MSNIRTLYLSAGMAAVLGIASCTTLDPYTGEKKTSNAAKGAGIGALIGAVAGAATGDDSADRRKRALIGAGVGALSGTAVGAYMDNQEMKLRQKLAGTGVSVTRQGDNLILNMPSNVTFDSGQSTLKAAFDPVLDGVSMVLKEYDKTVIEVAGHTDSDGENAMNQALSENRASAVASGLYRNGIGERRIVALGFGEGRPVASNASDGGKALNRRVELTLLPLTGG
jgi:outer membrane protein OmpA-like peptidoglycan-associated protein